MNKFAHDPLGANGNLEVLKRSNIEYDILRFNCQFLKKPFPTQVGRDAPDRLNQRHKVRKSAASVNVTGDVLNTSERLLISAVVDDVPVLSDNEVVNEFLIVLDSGCTTHTFNTQTYLEHYNSTLLIRDSVKIMGGNKPDPSKHVVIKWKPVPIPARHIRRYIKENYLSLVELDKRLQEVML